MSFCMKLAETGRTSASDEAIHCCKDQSRTSPIELKVSFVLLLVLQDASGCTIGRMDAPASHT